MPLLGGRDETRILATSEIGRVVMRQDGGERLMIKLSVFCPVCLDRGGRMR